MPGYGQRSSSPVSQSRERSDPTFAALRKSPLDVLIFFQNSRIAAIAPKAFELRERDELPDDIYFYVTLASYDPTRVAPPKGYLHRAKTYLGHEAAGPCCALRFTPETVLGMQKHHLQPDGRCTAQLLLFVPVTRQLNPHLQESRLKFQPSNVFELHGGGEGSHLPRIIVPVIVVPRGMIGGHSLARFERVRVMMLRRIISPFGPKTPIVQRIEFGFKRWRMVLRLMAQETEQKIEAKRFKPINFAEAQIGSPYQFPFPKFSRAELDVPAFRDQGVTAVYFQNARVSCAAPRPRHLPLHHQLPPKVHFYVRTKTAEVPFPLPAEYKDCLLTAGLFPGHEYTGPVLHVEWGIANVVGLKPHHLVYPATPVAETDPKLERHAAAIAVGGRAVTFEPGQKEKRTPGWDVDMPTPRSSRGQQSPRGQSPTRGFGQASPRGGQPSPRGGKSSPAELAHFQKGELPANTQLVLVVPSTPSVNPGIEPTQITFAPTSRAHLSKQAPRLIVPIYPRVAPSGAFVTRTGHDRGLASGRIYKKLRMLFGQWENFTSHERMKASFRRWCIVSTLLPDLAAQRVKKAGRGTPYVEEMPRNRLRWPRLDVAMHLNIRSKGGNDAIQPSYMAPTPRGTRISEAMKAFASADSGERFDMGPPFDHVLRTSTPNLRRSRTPSPPRVDHSDATLEAAVAEHEETLQFDPTYRSSTPEAVTRLEIASQRPIDVTDENNAPPMTPRTPRSASPTPRGRSPSPRGSPSPRSEVVLRQELRGSPSPRGGSPSPRGSPRSPSMKLGLFERGGAQAGSPKMKKAGGGLDELALIGKLKELWDQGAISERIFEDKRKELLLRV